MVQVIQNPSVIRAENYENINKILYPDFYIRPYGTGANIFKRNARVGELFLDWDNYKITIEGDPSQFWSVANRLEEYGYFVLIESPYKIERRIISPTCKHIAPANNEIVETIDLPRKCSIIDRIKHLIG